jgi:cytochrome P450
MTKAPGYIAMVHRAPNLLTMFDQKEHGRRRRLMSQGFSDTAMRAHEDTILEHALKFCKKILADDENDLDVRCKEGWTKPKNMSRWCKYFQDFHY